MLISVKWMFKAEFRPTKKDPAADEWRTGPDHRLDVEVAIYINRAKEYLHLPLR